MKASIGPLLVRLDPAERDPLQVQLYTSIRGAILDGVLTPGAKLPSSRELATDLGVSRTTAVLAFDRLAAEGYIEARAGSGTFVTLELPDERPRRMRADEGPSRHPALSARGQLLALSPPTVIKIEGPPRAFRIGTPALDVFPRRRWSRIITRLRRMQTEASLDYGPALGLPRLRDAIAAHVSRARGTSCSGDQVVVTAGAQQALDLISRLLLDPGDVAWLEEPGYPGARAALAAAGADIHPVPVDEHGVVVPAGVAAAARPRLAYVTPSHQFPLGVQMTLARRLSLLTLARELDTWIVEDDYDSEFRYGAQPVPCLHGIDADGRVIYVGSFSKTLFPALRIGYLIVPADLVDAVRAARRATDIHVPTLDQAVVAEFIEAGDYERHLRRMRQEYRGRRDALLAAAQRHCGGGLSVRPVATGLHAVADLCDGDAAAVSHEALARGVEVMPLSAYCQAPGDSAAGTSQAPPPHRGLVLGFGAVRPESIEDGMKSLAVALDRARRISAT
jgi:GntR family transcriptional regulator/MocR family aminotransferase